MTQLQFPACTDTTANPPKVPAGFSTQYSYGPVTTQQQRHLNVLQDFQTQIQFTA